MADETPTIDDIEDLRKQMDILEAEMQEMMKATSEILNIATACEAMAARLAAKFEESVSDWWWIK